jgi:hypothetical protein
MQVKLGDELTFDVAGETVSGRVTSLREVRWDSFQPNFFVVFSPGVLDKVTGTLITSVHVRPEQRRSLADLVRQFPEVTIIDVDALLTQVREVMDKASGCGPVRVPVHAGRGCRRAARGRAGDARRATLRERDAADARRKPANRVPGRRRRIHGARHAGRSARSRGARPSAAGSWRARCST